MKTMNINAPINGTGYGITSLNIIKAIHAQNIDISLFPIGNNVEINSEIDRDIIRQLLQNSNSFDYSGPCLKIWHQHDLALKIGNGKYYVLPFFELDRLTQREQHHINYADYVFVASHWAKEVLEKNNINKPIYVSPLGVDLEIFQAPNKIKVEKENYVFFHIGKWEKRKSQDFLLKAFESAFTENDNVELWLLPFNPFLSEQETQEWLNLVENNKLKNKIKIFNRLPTQYHLAEFIYHADCGVFPSRAEGWNNEIIESMAMNKPIIATNYSAHTEYCNDKNCYLIDTDELEIANDGKWFLGNGNWAKLDRNELDQTVNYMKYVYTNHINNNPEGVLTAKQYSWTNTADIILQTIKDNDNANTR
ncbi:MAG: glycosyltransferase [Sphingobacteriia bacterium]|nr:glycosyltransferase [Sphingobacteriia bacterium]